MEPTFFPTPADFRAWFEGHEAAFEPEQEALLLAAPLSARS